MTPKKVSPQKASVVANLKDLVSRSKSIAVVDYKGLKVNQANDLRRAVRKAGGQVIVTKNTLFTLASGHPDLSLTGPSAFIFSLTDEVSAIKAAAEFAQKNTLPTFKSGLMADRVLTREEISTLASLPPKNILLAQTVSALKSPLSRLTTTLNWNITG